MKNIKKFWIFHALLVLVSTTPVSVVAEEYRFVGYSLGKTTGDAGGPVGMHAHCQARFNFGKSARMCTTREWWRSPNAAYPPADRGGTAWIQTETVAAYHTVSSLSEPRDIVIDWTGTAFNSAAGERLSAPHTCRRWTGTEFKGVIVDDDGLTAGDCETPRVVTCCVPAAR